MKWLDEIHAFQMWTSFSLLFELTFVEENKMLMIIITFVSKYKISLRKSQRLKKLTVVLNLLSICIIFTILSSKRKN
jgi:hypothetical protein